ncbi:uncharacterized protein LOC117227657 isoform X1 [Megalopta genalis]|uniref:uncharacterized protein LOC117227657 isoform X1 n=1 Tax=Megalopta genalis TaxID=115081 RepID=UPI003FD4AF4F
MKWKKGSTEFLPEKTFLVIKDDLQIVERQMKTGGHGLEKEKQRGKSQTPDTGTWPPKVKRGAPLYGDVERPKTANLEKPSILDPKLVNKLDMSLLSKELLSDSMTRFRHTKAISGGVSSRCRGDVTFGGLQQQQHRPPSNGVAATWSNGLAIDSTRLKRRSFEQILDLRLGLAEVSVESPRMQKQARITGQDVATIKKGIDNRKLDDNNNRNGMSSQKISSLSMLKKRSSRPTIQNDLEVFMSTSMKGAPEPCRSCGKPDQPERFHSHPKGTTLKLKDSPTNSKTKTTLPKTVQKPVALNFRSDRNKNKVEEVVQQTKQKSESPREQPALGRPYSAPTKKGPRTITCYICGREFGTASFPIHEPRCMQKWERENNSLPASQKRPTPRRPDVAIDDSEWNTAAWEKSQAQLLPCPKCARTFLPERLPVHTKSCKASPKNPDTEKSEISLLEKPVNTLRPGPPTVACQNCGRNFGTKSIKIHEPQCIERSRLENVKQLTQPRRKDSQANTKLETVSMQELSISPVGEQQKRTVTCYICGRDFGSSSLVIHEPQCLRKWHAENEKLPPDRRRKEPQRPEVIYARDPETGNTVVDVTAMAEASWKSHLNQLIPCKHCARTFNPDRVSVHERSCKGNR